MLLTEELAGVGHWSLHIASGKVEWSRQVYRIHGLDPAKFEPDLSDALGFYDDRSRQTVSGHISRTIATGEGFAFKAHLTRPSDGATRTVLSRGELIRDEETGATTIFGVFQDVTDQDVLLQQVMAERERYRLLTYNATDVIATYSPDATFTYISSAVTALCGRTPEDLVVV